MKQILQNLKNGDIELAEVSSPKVKPGHLLIQTTHSLISSGTERMLVTFAKSGLLNKAKQQPDKVKQVIDKIKTDGLFSTMQSVSARLDEPLPLGYCNAGQVIAIGDGVEGYEIGDRVASNGSHAEIVCVPKHLCAKIPSEVSNEHAAFTVISSIAIQGVRLLNPTLGETIVVFGLGLIGLITVQLLKSCGCQVIGIDLDEKKIALAEKYGAHTIHSNSNVNAIDIVQSMSRQRGADGVIITAATKNDSIVHQAAQMCRKRGRIILVGVVNLNLNRADFYEKELKFQVSCSYGPGRYDTNYEQQGHDYPIGFVRWTEHRNFETVLNQMASGTLNVSDLISQRIDFHNAQQAYNSILSDKNQLGIVFEYSENGRILPDEIQFIKHTLHSIRESNVVVGLIGAGNFAKMTLMPKLAGLKLRLKAVADINGVTSAYIAKKYQFESATNDYTALLNDPDINTIFITTQHNLHAQMVVESIARGKHVFVEKPLCLNLTELHKISETLVTKTPAQHLLIGFNRRFSPHAQKISELLKQRYQPICINFLINAGYIPSNTWIQDHQIGGGRMIGEGCHWIDLMRFWIGHPITSVSASMIGPSESIETCEDKIVVTLQFKDGSIGTLQYLANGHKSYPKEMCQIFLENKIIELDNFRKMRCYGFPNRKKMYLRKQDKGHMNEFRLFVNKILDGEQALIPFDEIKNVTLATFAAVKSALENRKISIDELEC